MERIICHTIRLLLVATTVSFVGCGAPEQKGKFTAQQMVDFENETAVTLPPVSGGLVLAVGEETIKAEDVVLSLEPELSAMAQSMQYTEFYPRAYPIVGRKIADEATSRLLYEAAKKDAGDKLDVQLKKLVEAEIAKFLTVYGNNYAEAEKALRERGVISWKEYRKLKMREILLGVYYQKQMKEFDASVSNEEMMEYYNANKEKYQTEGVMEFMLIDIVKARVSAGQDALVLANDIVTKLRAGEDFAELAKKYSNGVYAAKGGAWSPRRLGNLAEPYDVLEEEFKEMQAGQISDPIEIDGRIFIAKLIRYQTQSHKPFYQVRGEIEGIVSFENRLAYVSKISSQEVDISTIPHLEEFIKSCVSQAYKTLKVGR